MNGDGTTDADARFGVVGDDPAPLMDAIEGAGGTATAIDADATAAVDVVVAPSESSLLSLVRADVETPVLPVDVGPAVVSVPLEDLRNAAESILRDEHTTFGRPLLVASFGGLEYRSLMDVTLVTTEPAKISEYTIETRARGARRVIDTVRADGVVVSTPTGSPGYGLTAGGPVMAPESRSVSVVPIGPFRIEQTHWTLRPPMWLTVARDETAVSLLVDDMEVRRIPPHESIRLEWTREMEFLETSVSVPLFE
ncbi:MAG: ATP-NAD kinase [Halanaeroarchaeum sp.]